MTTEYYLQEGETHESLARDLLEQAAHPDQVIWRPRPDVYGGGVYELADEAIAQRVREVRAARRRDEAARADFLATLAAADEDGPSEDVEPAADEDSGTGDSGNGADGEAADGDEPRLTPAQRRAAARATKKQAEAEQAAADEEKSE